MESNQDVHIYCAGTAKEMPLVPNVYSLRKELSQARSGRDGPTHRWYSGLGTDRPARSI